MTWVSLDRLLLGDEWGVDAAKYARITGDLTRPSTPLSRSPHVKLLEEYRRIGEEVLTPKALEGTAYYQNAAQCIDIFGNYFEARSSEQIQGVARRFVESLTATESLNIPRRTGQSSPYGPITSGKTCRPIQKNLSK